MDDPKAKTAWSSLGKGHQTQLLIEFGHPRDPVPPTCESAVTVQRLRDWLDQRGIVYPGDP